jgi:hypothetical protein
MRNLKLLCILLLFTTQLSAIDINRKFGKVSKEELLMDYYDKDSSASAVILFDIGKTNFEYDTEKNGFVMVYERHVRIKIINKDGFDYGDFSLSLYNNGGNYEKVFGLKAYTYNLENGKIEDEKLNKKDIYNIEDSKTRTLRKFSLPSIREGSVIEVKYSIQSDFFYNLQEWNFQHFIPIMWSEYTVEIPEYFTYNTTTTGYLPFELNKSNIELETHTIGISTQTTTGYLGYREETKLNLQEIKFKKKIVYLAVKDAPAMKSEAFMLSSNNYISKVKFELSSIKYPYEKIISYSKTWESINKNLLKHSKFGLQLKNRTFLNEVVQEIKESTNNPEQQIMTCYNYLVNNYKWNERQSIYASQNLKETFKEKSGNTADINLLMTLLLREAGFDADPVILSTRGHGLLNPVHPSLSQMNYVVTLLRLNGKDILIDATDPYCLPGILPPKCINDKGRVISETNSSWINIDPAEKYNYIAFGDFKISEQKITGTLASKRTGFASYNFRKKFKKFNNKDEYIVEFESDHPNFKIQDHKIENIDTISKPVKEEFTNLSIESIENMGDLIYFNPIILDRINENPFKMEERNYPINYNYLYNQKYIFNYVIPEGYIVDETPKSALLELPEGFLKYKYLITTSGNTIQVTVEFEINKRLFLPNDYENLKNFYNKIIEKEQVVLKKA